MSKRIVVLALSIGIAASASAQLLPKISLNFTDGGTLGGPSGTGTAGAELAPYWNEVAPGGNDEPIFGTDLNNLLDDSGSASGVSLTQGLWVGGWWNSDAYPGGMSGTIGNDMMGNFQDFGTSELQTLTLDGLNAGVGARYDVLIYNSRGFGNSGVVKYDVNGQTKYLANESTAGDYAESGWSSQALAESNLSSGNYVRFYDVTLDTLVVGVSALEDLTNGGSAGSISGLQIVAVPEPATFGLLAIFGGAMVFLRRTRNY